MPIDAAKALAAEPRTGEISWNTKDVQLYHLGIGAACIPTNPAPPPIPTNCATPSNPGCTSCRASPRWRARGRRE